MMEPLEEKREVIGHRIREWSDRRTVGQWMGIVFGLSAFISVFFFHVLIAVIFGFSGVVMGLLMSLVYTSLNPHASPYARRTIIDLSTIGTVVLSIPMMYFIPFPPAALTVVVFVIAFVLVAAGVQNGMFHFQKMLGPTAI